MARNAIDAGNISQSVVVAGSDNLVTLTFGATGVALPLVRRHIPAPRRRARRELDLLRADADALPFVGRVDLRAELHAWLNEVRDISVHALTGRAGTGKTRLAIQLCAEAKERGWLAGFLAPGDLAPMVDTLAAHSFAWSGDTLLVLDYAARIADPLGRWLDRLAATSLSTRLRILLLEREAPEQFGWWRELTDPPLDGAAPRRDLFHSDRPRPSPTSPPRRSAAR